MNERIKFLRQLWNLRCSEILLPLSSSFETFLLCLSSFYAKNPLFVEYGPFTGQTSSFLCSIATRQKGSTLLVDNFHTFTTKKFNLPLENFTNILEANINILGKNNYTILNQDITENPYTEQDPGFVYFDICLNEKTANTICLILEKLNKVDSPAIVVIDDVVTQNLYNEKFSQHFLSWYKSHTFLFWYEGFKKNKFEPFLVTHNKLFLSNFDMPTEWFEIIEFLAAQGMIKQMEKKSSFHDMPIWTAVPGNTFHDTKIMTNNQFWEGISNLMTLDGPWGLDSSNLVGP